MSDAPIPPAHSAVQIRPPTRSELPAVAVLAAQLVREHHAWDPQRFMLHEPVEIGYERFLASQLNDTSAVLLAAFVDGRIVGYAYGALEPRDWVMLLDPCAGLHDLYVDKGARHLGVAHALIAEILHRFRELGAPRAILYTAWQNEKARGLFESLGFRPTMVEMTRELE